MNLWQVVSAAVATFLLATWAVLAVRTRTRTGSVMTALFFAVPIAGFGAYALVPGASPPEATVILLATLLYGAVLVASMFRLVRRRRRGGSQTLSTVNRPHMRRQLILRLIAVVWMNSFLFLFEPVYAVVGLALNLVWCLLWIPTRWRTDRYSASSEIAAPPATVFEFLTDPQKWPLYREDVEVTSVSPDGMLAVGTEFSVRTPVPDRMKRLAGPYRQVESVYRVTAITPGRAYSISLVRDPTMIETHTNLEPTPNGTRVTIDSKIRFGFEGACLGATLELPLARAVRRSTDQRRFARLAEVIKAAPS